MVISKVSAMPQQDLKPYPPGASSPMTAGVITQNNQAERQNALIGNTGGSKRGGAVATNASPVVQVPSVPSGAVSPEATGANYKAISELAQEQATNAVYDTAKNSGDTALIEQQQGQQYKVGGRRRKSSKRRRSKSKRRSSKRKSSKRRRKSSKSRKSKKHY
jgi:hypothetical protein